MIYSIILFFSSLACLGNIDIAQSMVPRGKVIEVFGRDFVVKTLSGSKIIIEFKRDGAFQEASGRNLNQGDEFEPGEGLMTLGSAAKQLQSFGEKVQGHWRLEEDKELGWIYEFQTAVLNAKTGFVIHKITKKEI
jgi:hypothetical protein